MNRGEHKIKSQTLAQSLVVLHIFIPGLNKGEGCYFLKLNNEVSARRCRKDCTVTLFWALSLKEYEICVTTGDTDETKENAWIILEGKKCRSKELVMENSSKKKRFLR